MIGEGVGLVAEKTAEATITASEVADFGAIKPNGFGSLIRRHLTSEVVQQRLDALHTSEFPQFNLSLNSFDTCIVKERPYCSIRYNDISKECSEYLRDYGITPWVWKEATIKQKMNMLGKAIVIIGQEFDLPEEWMKEIKPIGISGEDYIAQASCKVSPLNSGGVNIVGIPTLKVDLVHLTDDYLEVMSSIYHEMIHIKQYASINCVDPGLTADLRLVGLIQDLKNNRGTPKRRVSYLYSPYEAEAWAQKSYFRRTLAAEVDVPHHISTINEGLEGETYPETNVKKSNFFKI